MDTYLLCLVQKDSKSSDRVKNGSDLSTCQPVCRNGKMCLINVLEANVVIPFHRDFAAAFVAIFPFFTKEVELTEDLGLVIRLKGNGK